MQDLGCMIDHIRYTMYDVQTTLNLNIEHWRLLIISQYQYPATSIRNLNREDAKTRRTRGTSYRTRQPLATIVPAGVPERNLDMIDSWLSLRFV